MADQQVQGLAARSWVIHYADDNGNPAQGLNAIVSGPRVLPADPVVEVGPLSVAEKLADAAAVLLDEADDATDDCLLVRRSDVRRLTAALAEYRQLRPAGEHREEGQP